MTSTTEERRSRPPRLPEQGVIGLLAQVLKGVPRLDDASCTSRAGIFSDPRRIGEAKAICTYCPALADCAAWAAGERALTGVIAGELRGAMPVDDDQDETVRGARQ